MGRLEDGISQAAEASERAAMEIDDRASREQAATQKAVEEGSALAAEFVDLAIKYGVPRDVQVFTETYEITRIWHDRHPISGSRTYHDREQLVSRDLYAQCWCIAQDVYITSNAMTLESKYTPVVVPGEKGGIFRRGKPEKNFVIKTWDALPFVDFMLTTPDGDGGSWDLNMVSVNMMNILGQHKLQ